jgi:hypothetical protein
VSSVDGSGEHVAHPFGGDHVVDGWHSNKRPEKRGKRMTGGGHTSPGKETTHC